MNIAELYIPEEAQKCIASINEKVDKAELNSEHYIKAGNAYSKHIVGSASFDNPGKKNDLESYYKELTEIFRFEENELEFLLNDAPETALALLSRIFISSPESSIYKYINGQEWVLNYAWQQKHKAEQLSQTDIS